MSLESLNFYTLFRGRGEEGEADFSEKTAETVAATAASVPLTNGSRNVSEEQ